MLALAAKGSAQADWWDVSPAVTAALIALAIAVVVTPVTQAWLLNRRGNTDRALALLDHRLLAARNLTVPLLTILALVNDSRRLVRVGVMPEVFAADALASAYSAVKEADAALADVRLMFGRDSEAGQRAIAARNKTHAAFRATRAVKSAIDFREKVAEDDRPAADAKIEEADAANDAAHDAALTAVVEFEQAVLARVERD